MGKIQKIHIAFFVIVFILSGLNLFAQRGKNGVSNITAANIIINEYTNLTVNAASGANSITVANSGLNTNGRFTSSLSSGDLIFIIQVQGTSIMDIANDSAWGGILNYNNCGLYEFAEVMSVPNSTTINLKCPLINNYTASGRVQVIRVPRLSSFTINSGGSVTCDTWNGTIGGITVVEVLGNTTINGAINVNGKGFRGGQLENNTTFGADRYTDASNTEGAEKGEGVFGFQTDYDAHLGRYCRASGANGGGGGDAHNCGGGGGANAGNIAAWTGKGVPDISTPAWASAWNLETAGFSTSSSSGGGKGGYSSSNANKDALTVAPGDINWTGDKRRNYGGLGGRPLDYTTGRLFLGGGGGAGEEDNSRGGIGGTGGGMVYLMNYGSISGTGQVTANGNAGGNSTGATNNSDGAGGAGAGGTIVINSVGTISGVSLLANGGNGGNQVFSNPNGATEASGPGGGGGGGYIAVSNGTATQQVNGGANGTTNSFQLSEFIPNGATKGGNGVTSTITNFTLTANDDTICCGQSASLLVSINGNPPAGIIINWYKDSVGGNIIYTGNPYVTIPLCVDTVFYASTCPGTYRIPVKVKIDLINVTAGNNTTTCSGNSVQLHASGAVSYSWSPSTGLNQTNISDPTANPTITTTYIVTGTSIKGCTDTAKVVITVSPGTPINVSSNQTICQGTSIVISATGGNSYSWNSGQTTGSITVSPTQTTTYTVTGINSCQTITANVIITVTPLPIANAGIDQNVCSGTPVNLTTTGGTTYSWSNGQTANSITVSPTQTTTYTLTTTSSCGSATDAVMITIIPQPFVDAGVNQTICLGSQSTIIASGNGNFLWSSGQITNSITVSPTQTTTYTISASNSCNTVTDNIIVTVSPLPTATTNNDTTICSGSNLILAVTGGVNYIWSGGQNTSSINVSPTQTTVYTVTSMNFCGSATTDIVVVVTPLPSVNAGQDLLICSGTQTILTANGIGNFSWSTGGATQSITVAPVLTTTYIVSAINNCGKATDDIVITTTSIPTANAGKDTSICLGNNVNLTANGGSSYIWSNGQATQSIIISPTQTTTYKLTVTSNCGSATDEAVVSVVSLPTVVVSSDATICSGKQTTISATGSGAFLWSTGSNAQSMVVNPNQTTVYTVSAINSCGVATDNVVVNVNVSPHNDFNFSANCFGLPTQFTGICSKPSNQISSWYWNFGDFTSDNTQNPQHTYQSTEYYYVKFCVTDLNGCKDSITKTVSISNGPTADFSYQQDQVNITTVYFSDLSESNIVSWEWNLGDGGTSSDKNPVYTYDNTGTYNVILKVTNSDGCTDIIHKEIIIKPKPHIYIPNSFSPNSDGLNEYFNASIDQELKKFKLLIFTRWGELIFESNSQTQGWDGNYQGKIVSIGVYVYQLKVTYDSGEEYQRIGSVTVLR
ncbi:MAG: PKD domain-containing protein [Bacteroidales bacterium]